MLQNLRPVRRSRWPPAATLLPLIQVDELDVQAAVVQDHPGQADGPGGAPGAGAAWVQPGHAVPLMTGRLVGG